MTIEQTHRWEKALIAFYNLDGWELTHTGEGFLPYDASGYTPKNQRCIIEMKFRKKYYEVKMIEKFKYDKMMQVDTDCRLFFVNDPKGNYLFWLDDLKNLELTTMNLPATTYWNSEKIRTEVYLLPESKASIVNLTADF